MRTKEDILEADVEKKQEKVDKLTSQLKEAKEALATAKKNLKSHKTVKKPTNKCLSTDARKVAKLKMPCTSYKENEARVLFLAHKITPSYLKSRVHYLDGDGAEAREKLRRVMDKVVEKSNARAGDILFLGTAYPDNIREPSVFLKTEDYYVDDEQMLSRAGVEETIKYWSKKYPNLNYDIATKILHELDEKFILTEDTVNNF